MAKKSSSKKDYFGMGRVISIIFAIIPVTSWLFGVITRFMEHKFLSGILRLLLGWNIIWLCDLIWIIVKGRIVRILNI